MKDRHTPAMEHPLSSDELISLDGLLSELAGEGPVLSESSQISEQQKKRDEEESQDTADTSTAAPLQLAASDYSSNLNQAGTFTDASTDYQIITQPPEGSGAASTGFSIPPLAWTALGVLGIVALDSQDDSNDSEPSGNRAPRFASASQDLNTDEDLPLAIDAQASDADGDELSYQILIQPQHGSLEEADEAGLYTYTPEANYAGDDSFSILVRDTEGNSASQSISITINPVEDAPALEENQYISGDADQDIPIIIDVSDAEGDPLSYSNSEASNGTVTLGDSPGVYFYSPDDGFSGEDSFTVTVSDGKDSSTQTVNLRIGLGNADPQLDEAQSISTAEDESVSFTVEALDVDGDSLSYSASVPANGSVEQDDSVPGAFTYTPRANFYGQDSFTVTVEDGMGGSASQTISVEVSEVGNDVYSLSVADVEQDEGDDGVSIMTFTLTLDAAPFGEELTVAVESIDGIATAGDDYNLLSSEVVFADGQDTAVVEVEIIGDERFGIDESFTLNFSGEQLVEAVSATGTIVNDDADPSKPVYTLTANSTEIVEGNSGTKNLVFDLQLDRAAEQDFTIQASTIDGSAIAGEDYIAVNSPITFDQGEDSATVIVRVGGDTVFEGDEDFQLSLRNVQLSDNITVTGTILNNDLNPDAQAPVMSLAEGSDSGSSDSDNITDVTSPSFVISAEPGGEVQIAKDGAIVGSATEQSPGVYTFSSEPLAEGQHSFAALLSFPNVSETVAGPVLSITIDSTAPELDAINADAQTNSVELSFSEALGLFDDSGDIQLYIDDVLATITGVSQSADDTLSFQLQEDLQAGSVVDVAIELNAVTDLAGNGIDAVLLGDDPTGVTA